MNKIPLIASAVVALSLMAGFRIYASGSEVQASNEAEADSSPGEGAAEQGEPSSMIGSHSAAEHRRVIRKLTEELKQKEIALARAETGLASALADMNVSEETRAARRAMGVLEERLVKGGIDGTQAQRERQSVEAVVRRLLPSATGTEVICSAASMCRVTIRRDEVDEGKMSQTMESLSDELGKSYPAMQTLSDGEDDESLYLAKSGAQLDTDPRPESKRSEVPHIVHEADVPGSGSDPRSAK